MSEKKKVLIVEDDEALLELYEKNFIASGYDVFKASDGGQGLKTVFEVNPDAIILDVMLPVMNGFEVLKNIKKDTNLSNIPVIMLSNYGEVPNITEGIMAGAVEYLIKVEHNPKEIVEIVTEAIVDSKA